MSLCNICSQQHHHEQQKLRRILLWGLLGSVGVHAVGFSLSHLPRWQTVTEDLSPIELIVTEALPIEPEVAPNPEPPAELSSQTNDPAPAAASAPPRPAAIVAPPRLVLSPVKAATPYTPEPDPPAASAWETPAVAEAETLEDAKAVTEAVTPETEVDTLEDEVFELDTDTPEAETSEAVEAEADTPEVDTSEAVEAGTIATEADTSEVIEAGATATGEDEAPSDRLTALLQRLRTSQAGAGPSPAVVPTESVAAGGGNVPNAPLGNEPGVATAPSTNHGNGQGQSARTVACQNCVRPNYPQNALSAGAEGQPVVSVDINPDGSVGRVRLTRSSGNAAIDQAAIEAAQQSRFQPVAGGASVPIEYDLTIEGSRRNRAARRRGERQSVEVPAAPNSATAATEAPPPAAPSPSDSSDSAREVAPAAAPQTTPTPTAESSTPETASMPEATSTPEADSSAPDPDPPSQGNPVEADPTAPALEPALPSSSPPSSFPPATGSSPAPAAPAPAAPAVPAPVPAPAVAPPSTPPPIAPPPSVAPVAPATPAAAPATREE